MNDILAKQRDAVLKALIACGIVCVGALWWFETRTGLITELDRYGYPGLLIIFAVGLLGAILVPSRRTWIELACYFGIGLYFIAAIATFSVLQAGNNIYTIANTLQWMPIIYIVAFMFFEKKLAILAGLSVFLLSALTPLAVLAVKGPGFWDISVGALLINAYVVHFLVLLTLSLFIVLHDQFVQASAHARRMESTAQTDQLTGIANRRGLEAILDRHGEAPAQPITLILVDIDHFKRINDRYGHMIGDEALCLTAHLIQDQLRPTDVVGRWGGEEFLIIATDTTPEAGLELAERVRRSVNSFAHPLAGALSISAGTAVWTKERSLRDALHLADLSLYAAKQRGRNRVETFDLQAERRADDGAGLAQVR